MENEAAQSHHLCKVSNRLQLKEVRCVLPLSSVTKFSGKNLGTRHRAGLGITEQIDVVVLIISEETGAISIAEGGILTIDIPKKDLHTVLRQKLSDNHGENES